METDEDTLVSEVRKESNEIRNQLLTITEAWLNKKDAENDINYARACAAMTNALAEHAVGMVICMGANIHPNDPIRAVLGSVRALEGFKQALQMHIKAGLMQVPDITRKVMEMEAKDEL